MRTQSGWWARVLACLLWSGAALPAAQAEVWSYVDGAGVAHLASHQVDSRYSPLLRQSGDDQGVVHGKKATRHSLLTWLEFAPEVKAVQPWLREAQAQTGVDMELLKAMIAVESGFRRQLVSPRGAIGLMQIMPETADRYATRQERGQPAEQRLRDARTNILTGARVLADLTRRFQSVDLVVAAWNAGEGRVRRAGYKLPAIRETRSHVHLVLELYWQLLQQRQSSRVQELNLSALAATPAATEHAAWVAAATGSTLQSR